MIRATLTGAEYAKKRTGKIPAAIKRATRQVVGRIVRDVAKDAKANIKRSRTGLLAKSLGSVVRTYKNEKTVGIAGPRAGFKSTITGKRATARRTTLTATRVGGKTISLKGGARVGATLDPGKYGRLVERGHRKGRGRSKAIPKPFLAPAAAKANRRAKEELSKESLASIKGTA